MQVYAKVVTSMLTGMTPEQVLAFKPTAEMQDRASELLHTLKSSKLTPDKLAELNHLREVEAIIRLAKARAYQHVKIGTFLPKSERPWPSVQNVSANTV
jgi:hypothetical protein